MEKIQMETLSSFIIEWAQEKNINNPQNQYLKIVEEIGETCGALLKGNKLEAIDGFGDIGVTIIIYAWQYNGDINFRRIRTLDNLDEVQSSDVSLLEHVFHALYELSFTEALFNVACLCFKHGFDFEHCLNAAWQVIKNRQGKTVNGTFIKESE